MGAIVKSEIELMQEHMEARRKLKKLRVEIFQLDEILRPLAERQIQLTAEIQRTIVYVENLACALGECQTEFPK